MQYTLVEMTDFADWLLAHRTAQNMKQKDVAKKARVSVSYISTIENRRAHSITGAALRPEPEKVEALAKAVGGNVDDALEAAGYARKVAQFPPQTIADLIKELERLGIDDLPQLHGGLTDDPELLEKIRADITSIVWGNVSNPKRHRPTYTEYDFEENEKPSEKEASETDKAPSRVHRRRA